MDAGAVSIRWAAGTEDVEGALRVRDRVFCDEQGVPRSEERDELDDTALHLVALQQGGARIVGTLRLLAAGDVAKIGRVAVERDWRRRGIASRMLEIALVVARERGCVQARLASQLDATALYRGAGFTVESEPFEDAGIPHVWMGRSLVPSSHPASAELTLRPT
jgi:predicted GNAT family N-acyltransferase